ncbi:hypothetical protein FCM35_KLT07441 [Carex littledalei]|uniref:Uncharacterized protein n=1 Tax=Carex littledalei TaxID=544730 RepID=A0A833QYS7_9POAL|nr:hypothetical protein FCM35_KLT07441 [Carex littledalei]
METKSGKILIDNELHNLSKDSEVRDKDLQTESLLVQTPSSDTSTLTQTLEYEEEVLDSGCQTPREFIFDPFAPGPEELCLAPKRKNNTRNPLRRQLSLSFDLSFPILDLDIEFEESEKEEIQNICKSFLDLIISDVLEICEEKLPSEKDGFKTPTKMPLLTGFADTCPGAPIRPALKMQSNLKPELCRKLDFDSDLD